MAIVRENEEKKRYLNGYRDCTRREQQLQEQIDELRSQQMFPSVNHDGMPQGTHTATCPVIWRGWMHLSANWSMSRLWRYGSTRKSMTGYIRCRTGRRRKF